VGNRVSRNGAGVVAADGASHNLIAENTVRRNGSGVILDVGTHHSRVVGNVIDHSAFEGIAVVASDGNLIARNRVVRSGQVDPAGGIVIIPLPDEVSETSDANRVVHNASLENRGDGILVGEKQIANIVRANRAYRNTRLGIGAAPGTIDRGGNRAAHNGDPRQCVGVVCAR
jgi:parallel beta-helix repeat protein